MKILLLLAFLHMIACGSRERFISEGLKAPLREVLSWCEPCSLRDDIDEISFGFLDADTDGECIYGETRQIKIDPYRWAALPADTRLELLAHELAHCNWEADHEDDGLMDSTRYHVVEPARILFQTWYAHSNR